MFVATKDVFYCDKSMLVATNLLCVYLSWQTFCRGKKDTCSSSCQWYVCTSECMWSGCFARFVVCLKCRSALSTMSVCLEMYCFLLLFCSCVLWNVLCPFALLIVCFVKCTVSFCSFVRVFCEMYLCPFALLFVCFVKCTVSFCSFVRVFCEMYCFLLLFSSCVSLKWMLLCSMLYL